MMPWWAFWILIIWMIGIPYFTKTALTAMIHYHPEVVETPIALKTTALAIGCIWPYVFGRGLWLAMKK